MHLHLRLAIRNRLARRPTDEELHTFMSV